MKLYVVNHGTNRNLGQRQAVSRSYFGSSAAHNLHANFQSFRSQDVCFLAVCIADQSDVCCSVRIVLDRFNSCRNIIFSSLKVDDSVFSSASASAVSYSDFTLVVTSSVFLQGHYQRFLRCALRDFVEIRGGHVSSGRCIWVKAFDSHYFVLLSFRIALMCAYFEQLLIKVLRRSRCLCCPRSEQRLLSCSLQFFQLPFHGVCSFRPCSWCLRF